jgi:hypothetical protein
MLNYVVSGIEKSTPLSGIFLSDMTATRALRAIVL